MQTQTSQPATDPAAVKQTQQQQGSQPMSTSMFKSYHGSWSYDGPHHAMEEKRRSGTIELLSDGTCRAKRTWDHRTEKPGEKPHHDEGLDTREGQWSQDPNGQIKMKLKATDKDGEKEVLLNETPTMIDVMNWPWTTDVDSTFSGLLEGPANFKWNLLK